MDWQTQRTMSGTELLEMFERLDMSQAACGRFIGRSERTMRRYVTGELTMHPAEVLLLRGCLAMGIKPVVPPWQTK